MWMYGARRQLAFGVVEEAFKRFAVRSRYQPRDRLPDVSRSLLREDVFPIRGSSRASLNSSASSPPQRDR